MPWKEYTMEQSRLSFVTEATNKEISFSELCRKYDITRNTGYKWLNRFKAGLPLSNQSKAPFHTPNKTPIKYIDFIVA